MNVVAVTPYPPKPDGIGFHTRALLDAQREAGATTEVVTLARPSPALGSGDGVHRLLRADPRSIEPAHALVRSLRPDVVHIQFALPSWGPAVGTVARLARRCRRDGIPVVWTLHEIRRELDLLRTGGRVLYRTLLGDADHVIVHTTDAAALVPDVSALRPDQVSLLPLGAAPPRGARRPRRDGSSSRPGSGTDPVALCFGYVHIDKGLEHLVSAAARVRDRGIPLEVVIAGTVRPRSGVFRAFGTADRRYEQRLHDQVHELGLDDRVHFEGFVPDDDVDARFAAASVVVVPYTKVTQSSVLATALGAGVPVIASSLPGLVEMLDGAGILVPPAAPGPLADALASVVTDPTRVADLRAAAAARGAQLTFPRVADLHLALYRRVAGTRHPQEVVGVD